MREEEPPDISAEAELGRDARSVERDPEDAAGDVLEVYPRERYEAARDGRMTAAEFAEDLHRHVESQLPRQYRLRLRAARLGH